MSTPDESTPAPDSPRRPLGADWWAVIVAAVVVLLAALHVLPAIPFLIK
jgi:hypothetical protein